MTGYVVVHVGGYSNPFLGSLNGRECWFPDRERARVFHDKGDAEQVAAKTAENYAGNHVIADELEHPEVEVALLKCFMGDLSDLAVVQDYRKKAGTFSLHYFVRSALTGTPDPLGGRRNGKFGELLDSWASKA